MAKSHMALCVGVTGNPAAGILLYRIRWWHTYTRDIYDGVRYVANTSTWWSAQTGLSRHQVDRAMLLLEELGLIHIKNAPHPKQAGILKCRWVWLSDYAYQILFTATQVPNIEVSEATAVLEQIGLAPAPKHIAKDSSKEIEGYTKPATGSVEAATVDLEEKAEEESLALGPELSVDEIQKIWKQGCLAFSGSWTPDFAGQERIWALCLIKTTKGQDLRTAIKVATVNWESFVSYVAAAKGLKESTLPTQPHFHTAFKNLECLINFSVEKQKQETQKLNSKKGWFEKTMESV